MAEVPQMRLPVTAEVTTELVGDAPRSWRITRMILSWVAVIALVELIIFMTVALAFGVTFASRLAAVTDQTPAPAATGCPFGPDLCGG